MTAAAAGMTETLSQVTNPDCPDCTARPCRRCRSHAERVLEAAMPQIRNALADELEQALTADRERRARTWQHPMYKNTREATQASLRAHELTSRTAVMALRN